LPGGKVSLKQHLKNWSNAREEIGRKLEYISKSQNCAIFRCDLAFPAGSGTSQVIGPFTTEMAASCERTYMVANFTMTLHDDRCQVLLTPHSFSKTPATSYQRQNERMNIGARCRIKWMSVPNVDTEVASLHYLSENSLMLLLSNREAIVVNTSTMEIVEASKEQLKLVSAIMEQPHDTPNFAWIDEDSSAGLLSQDGHVCVWRDSSVPSIIDVLHSSWLFRLAATNPGRAEFAALSKGSDKVAIWNFS